MKYNIDKTNRPVYLQLYKQLREDINAVLERDPAARTGVEVFLLYPGIGAVMWHRLSHFLYKH